MRPPRRPPTPPPSRRWARSGTRSGSGPGGPTTPRLSSTGLGIGTGLLQHAKDWAAAHGLHRLELTVMAHNTRAIRLYERMGFSVEGRRSECLLVDGQFIDELTMAAILPVDAAEP